MTLQVLFEDNHCLAVNKPAPLLTQAPPGIPSLEEMVRGYLKESRGKTGRVYLGVPHRLDRPVSGVVLFALQTKSAQRLSEQFEKKQVTKIYWGAVADKPTPQEGVWEDWIRKIPDQPKAEATEESVPDARLARLRYRCLADFPGGSLVEFQPETGRMHQIRLQASLRGHPVIGDAVYGSTTDFGQPANLERDRSIALHARQLTFLHPIRFEPITVTAPVPEVWNVLALDWHTIKKEIP